MKNNPMNKSTKTYLINFLKNAFVYIQNTKTSFGCFSSMYIIIFDKSLFQEAAEDLWGWFWV